MVSMPHTRVRPPVGQTTTTVVGGGVGLGMDMGIETERMDIIARQTRDLGSESEQMGFSAAQARAQGTDAQSMAVTVTGSATFPQGSDTQRQDIVAQQTRDLGTESESMQHTEAVTTPLGTDSQAMDSIRGTQTRDLGTDSQAMGFSAAQTRDLGSESESHVASAEADLTQYTTATAADTPDPPPWASIGNAQGNFDGTEATHPGLSGVDVTCDATLECSGLVGPATPSGFTRTDAFIRVRHRWDLTITGAVAGVVDAIHRITLVDNLEVDIGTLRTRSAVGGDGTQATLITEEFNIHALVTDAQIAAGLGVDFRVLCDYVPAVNGNTSWNVDGCHLVLTFVRTGIT